jgi:hypothetical protein
MKFMFFGILLFLLSAPALAAKPARIDVPSDPKAKYTAVDVTRVGDGKAEITTKRDGPSGTSYAKRLVDCRSMRFRYLGEGDTMEELNRSKPSPNMGPLVTGSISYHVSVYACRAVGQ